MARKSKAECVGESRFLGTWYQNISSLLILSPFLAIIIQILLSMLGFGIGFYFATGWVLLFCVLVFMPAGILFRCLAQPYFRITDKRWQLKGESPEKVFKWPIRGPYWLFSLLEFTGICFFAPLLYTKLYWSQWEWDENLWLMGFGGGVMLVGFMIFPLLFMYSRWLHKKAKETATWRHICYGCGYDLRGNLEAENCPECGHEIERERMDKLKAAGVEQEITRAMSE
ncbi:hypothetical protein KS4_21750 [Poriferisphaera corsica]|uniref:Uncharacterized protein n=1 Tax=Poriferisphaera corsica TaxID=2528020 RepID=A0A517YV37_9BACT|nr:hypothetical protein [Poriferisphaera corsica]QDU34113.1 hypothetical protein KS4_21750 [Poriferisphaera corsica]